jgi:hypothetical protein
MFLTFENVRKRNFLFRNQHLDEKQRLADGGTCLYAIGTISEPTNKG